MQILGRRYDSGEPVVLLTTGDRIAEVRPEAQAAGGPLPWIAPGFVDLQVNGWGGREFSAETLSVADVAEVSLAIDRWGVTSYYPTLTTNSYAALRHGLATIAEARRRVPEVACRVAGIHLEGPYISAEDGPRGAHPARHVRPPDWAEFQRLQDAAEGLIRIVTLAPEYPTAESFIRQAAWQGILVALGHTRADSHQIRTAVDAGARLSTHLGNGAHGMIRRHPNYIWDQLAEDRLAASLIVDGQHLPPAVVKTFLRAKTPSRCVLISDVTALAGLPPGATSNRAWGRWKCWRTDGWSSPASDSCWPARRCRSAPASPTSCVLRRFR